MLDAPLCPAILLAQDIILRFIILLKRPLFFLALGFTNLQQPGNFPPLLLFPYSPSLFHFVCLHDLDYRTWETAAAGLILSKFPPQRRFRGPQLPRPLDDLICS